MSLDGLQVLHRPVPVNHVDGDARLAEAARATDAMQVRLAVDLSRLVER